MKVIQWWMNKWMKMISDDKRMNKRVKENESDSVMNEYMNVSD